MEDAKKALDRAKIALMSKPDSAFFTTLCFSLRHLWDDQIPTACTNGKEIRFNTEFFLKLNQEERVFLLLHETLHVAFLHIGERLKQRDPRKWNIAGDFVINHTLIERGFKMPKGGLHDTQYAGMSTEQVYDLLPDDESSECPWEDLEPSDMPAGELDQEITDILVRAAVQSKMQGDKPGTIPGEIEIFLDKLLNPKLPWNVILRRFMNSLVKHDYTWRIPNRRFFPKHHLPSLYSEGLANIDFAIDTSGSVSDEEFAQFVTEIHHVIKRLQPEQIRLVQFDTEIKSEHVVRSTNELMQVKFQGRGGTRIEPVMDWLRERHSNVLVVITDGHFRMKCSDPGKPVIWIVHNNPKFAPAFGKVIHYTL